MCDPLIVKTMKIQPVRLFVCAIAILVTTAFDSNTSNALAQGTAFTYQGQLQNKGSVTSGIYNLQFSLYTAGTGGTAVAGPVTTNGVIITNGLFTVIMDFGATVWNGNTNWLEIGVETNGAGSFTTLTPRQQLTPAPYAIYAEGANALGLSGTIPGADLGGSYGNVVNFNNAGNSFTGNGAGLTGVDAAGLDGLTAANFWQLTGNAGTTPGLNYLGTPDAKALELHVDSARALRIEPGTNYVPYGFPPIPNIIGGSAGNFVIPTSVGNVIAGGGEYSEGSTNCITGQNYNFIGGGWNNRITNGYDSVIAGGQNNTAGQSSGTIGGGDNNVVNGLASTVPGGYGNMAVGDYSLAAGYGAQALNSGSFVWADDSGGTFSDTGPNQFQIRATGGVGVGTVNGPQQFLSVQGGENIDQANDNARYLNNGNTNGYGLSFGTGSGEGIASPRRDQGRGNIYGLDFYTGFALRMSIFQSGLVGIGIGTNAPASQLEVKGDIRTDGSPLELYSAGSVFSNDGIEWGTSFSPLGINSQDGPFVCGFNGGALGAFSPTIICLSWDYSGDVWVSNNCSVASLTIRGGADLAEPFPMSAAQSEMQPGSVVVIDDAHPGQLKLSDQPYDTRVAGVVSGANGIHPGIQMQQQGLLGGGKNVALTGRVYVRADASFGAIRPGDFLTTSATPGCAMKATDHARAEGAILGKAMTGLNEGTGMVLVLVTLQ